MEQPQLLKIQLDAQDTVYTPPVVAADVVDFFKPSGRILEPCKGDGVFLKYLPTADWCEIQEGKDFFAWTEPVDWLIGNPPYHQYTKWMRHSYSLANNIVYLIPLNKPFVSMARIRETFQWGKICHMRAYENARKIGWDFGFPVGAVHFQKGYKGPMYSSIYNKELI